MNIFKNNLKIFLALIIITGGLYPLAVTGLSQLMFKDKADGSLIEKNDKIIGSSLIAQEFKEKKYFWPRPSAANYDASASAASNLSPDSKALRESVEKRALEAGLDVKTNDDLLFASGSGLDPHISPASALRQVNRIVLARKLDPVGAGKVRDLILANIENRQLGLLGRERVNVLKLNLILDEKF